MPSIQSLPAHKQRYVKARLKGLTKEQAALRAGYSPTTAVGAGTQVESPDVRAVFSDIIRRAVPMTKLAKKLAEGLDATTVTFAQHEGKFTDERSRPDYRTRANYIELMAEYAGLVAKENNTTNVMLIGSGSFQPALPEAIDVPSMPVKS